MKRSKKNGGLGYEALARVLGIMRSKLFVPVIEESQVDPYIGWAGFRRNDKRHGRIVAFYGLFLDVVCRGRSGREV